MENKLNLVIVKNPFDRSDRDISVVESVNQSLLVLKNDHFPSEVEVIVTINGSIVPSDYLDKTFPQNNDYITFVPMITGGGGNDNKQILRTVLMIAVMVAATFIVGPEALAAHKLWAVAGFAAINVVGGVLINALIPLSPASDKASSMQYTWSPQTTQKEGVVCSRFYGRNKLHGNIINAYFDTKNEKHYSYILLSLGTGPYMDDEPVIKINNQNYSTYQGLTIETRRGYIDQNTISNHNQAVVDLSLNYEIEGYNSYSTADDGYIYTTPGSTFDALQIEIQFPLGLVRLDGKDGYQSLRIDAELYIKKVGDTSWIPILTTAKSKYKYVVDLSTAFPSGIWTRGCWVDIDWMRTDQTYKAWYQFEAGSSIKNDHLESPYGTAGILTYYSWRWIPPVTKLLLGNVTVAKNSKNVTGTNTTFTTSLQVGDYVGFNYDNIRTVTNIGTDTSITVDSVFNSTSAISSTQLYLYSTKSTSEEWVSELYTTTSFCGGTEVKSLTYNAFTVNNLPKGQYDIRIKYIQGYLRNKGQDWETGTMLLGDTIPSDSEFVGGQMLLSQVKEITYGDFQYPRQVLLAINALASSQISNSFDVSVLMDCAGIFVWNGTQWLFEYNNNPAYVAWNILTQPVVEISVVATSTLPTCTTTPTIDTWYQGGSVYKDKIAASNTIITWRVRRYDAFLPSRIDKAKWVIWASYCDEPVPNGKLFAHVPSAISSGATTITTTEDISSFPASGSGYIFDINLNTNPFEWTGRTSHSLTGCTGVTAHTPANPTNTKDIVVISSAYAERRHTFNGGFDAETTLWDALITVCKVGRAVPIWRGTTISLAIDSKSEPVNLVTIGNVNINSFEEVFLPLTDRSSEVEVDFVNSENNYNRDVYTVVNKNITTKTNKSNIQIIGVTKPSEAWRAGSYSLYCNQYLLRSAKLSLGVDAIAFTVGDVINVQHDVPVWGYGGRLESATSNQLILDREVTMTYSTTVSYSIMIRRSTDDVLISAPVINPTTLTNTTVSTKVLNFLSAFSPIPQQFDLYSFGESTKVVKPFRIISLQPTDDFNVTVSAIEYNPSIYAGDYQISPEPTPNYSSLITILDVLDLSLTASSSYDSVGTLIWTLVLSYKIPTNTATIWRSADVWYNINDGEWVLGASNYLLTYTSFLNVAADTKYTVKIVSVDNNGNKTNFDTAPTASCTTGGATSNTLGTISGLHIKGNTDTNSSEFNDADVTLTWNNIDVVGVATAAGQTTAGTTAVDSTLQFKDYEIVITDPNSASPNQIRRLDYTTTNEYSYTHILNSKDGFGTALREFKFRVRARDKSFNYSKFATITPINYAPAVVSSVHIEALIQSLDISFSKSSDKDTLGYKIFYSATTGFTPIDKPASNGGNAIDLGSQNMITTSLLTTVTDCSASGTTITINSSNTKDNFITLGISTGSIVTSTSSVIQTSTKVSSVASDGRSLTINKTATGSSSSISVTFGYLESSTTYYIKIAAYDKFGYTESFRDVPSDPTSNITSYYICDSMNISPEYPITFLGYNPSDSVPPPSPVWAATPYTTETENLQAGTSNLTLNWNAINEADSTQNDINQYEFRAKLSSDISNTYYYYPVASPPSARLTSLKTKGWVAGSQVVVAIRAIDKSNNVSAWTTPDLTITLATDLAAPAIPTNLVVTSTSEKAITLTFDSNSKIVEDFDHYEYHVSTSSISTGLTSFSTGTSTIKQISGLLKDTTYYARVKAVDKTGNKSNLSNESSAKTPKTDTSNENTPGAPTNLIYALSNQKVTKEGATVAEIELSWTASPATNVSYYDIWFSGDGGVTWNSAGAGYYVYAPNITWTSGYVSPPILNLTIALKAVTTAGVSSSLSNTVLINWDGDITAPDILTAGHWTLSSAIGCMTVDINQGALGSVYISTGSVYNPPLDFKQYKVYVGTTASFLHANAIYSVSGTNTHFTLNNDKVSSSPDVYRYTDGVAYYVKIVVYDNSGNVSVDSDEKTGYTGLVTNGDLSSGFSLPISKMFTRAIVLESEQFTSNSPSSGYISWNSHSLYYKGIKYTISAGNTLDKYIYWVAPNPQVAQTMAYSALATLPTLTDDDFLVATNVNGVYDMAWCALANAVIGNAYIGDLSASKINSGILFINDGAVCRSSFGGHVTNGMQDLVRDGMSYWYDVNIDPSASKIMARIGVGTLLGNFSTGIFVGEGSMLDPTKNTGGVTGGTNIYAGEVSETISLSGTASSSGTTITGTGSGINYLNEVTSGNWVGNDTVGWRKVTSITNSTTLVISSAFTIDLPLLTSISKRHYTEKPAVLGISRGEKSPALCGDALATGIGLQVKGKILIDGTTLSSFTTNTTNVSKLPIYDASGNFLGYIPIFM